VTHVFISESRKDINENIICVIAIYVDDIIVAGNNENIQIVKNSIKSNFEIKDLGNIDFIIGIKFSKINDNIFINQKGYINEILKKYEMTNSKTTNNLLPIKNEEFRKEPFNSTTYRGAIGSLLYIAIHTRPDILFTVTKAARYSTEPNLENWHNVLKILKYLKYTINYSMKFTNNFDIKAYVDADYAGDEESRRSTSGYIITIGNSPICWSSKLQHCVATSTAEAEYYSLSECGKQVLWLKNILSEIGINTGTIKIYIDNKAAIFSSENNVINNKLKHIDIRYHFIRELINNKTIKLEYIKSSENLADDLTKFLNGTKLQKFRDSVLNKI